MKENCSRANRQMGIREEKSIESEEKIEHCKDYQSAYKQLRIFQLILKILP